MANLGLSLCLRRGPHCAVNGAEKIPGRVRALGEAASQEASCLSLRRCDGKYREVDFGVTLQNAFSNIKQEKSDE
jgi:hypothetical protein